MKSNMHQNFQDFGSEEVFGAAAAAAQAAKEAAERGILVLSIGFGDENGSQIMMSYPETGARSILRDSNGEIVKSRLDGELLFELIV